MKHNTFNEERSYHSVVTTQTATFLFGGLNSRRTYEYLPKNSTKWLPGKTEIPGGFSSGCAFTVESKQEIWLIEGCKTANRLLIFNVNDHIFHASPSQLIVGRFAHIFAFVTKTSKVMITGGYKSKFCLALDSTEILDIEDGSVTMACSMNSRRADHGMGVITINGEEKMVLIGG